MKNYEIIANKALSMVKDGTLAPGSTLNTFDGWVKDGYHVRKGQKACTTANLWVNNGGKFVFWKTSLFSSAQVEKTVKKAPVNDKAKKPVVDVTPIEIKSEPEKVEFTVSIVSKDSKKSDFIRSKKQGDEKDSGYRYVVGISDGKISDGVAFYLAKHGNVWTCTEERSGFTVGVYERTRKDAEKALLETLLHLTKRNNSVFTVHDAIEKSIVQKNAYRAKKA